MSQLDEGRVGRHAVDVVSLVAGLAAVTAALLALIDVELGGGDLVVPVLLLVGGALGLVTSLRRGRDAGA